jgi:gluconolactonase
MTTDLSRRALIRAGIAASAVAGAGQALAQPQLPAPSVPLKPPYPVVGRVERYDPALDALIDVEATVEKVLDGFVWSEGPVWVGGADGYLLLSDVRYNQIVRWSNRTGGSTWRRPGGYEGPGKRGWDPGLAEPGTNGLTLARGGLVAADSGTRCLLRYDLKTKARTILADKFEGKRFNSPNDVTLSPSGMIYFTDPPYGLKDGLRSPLRELDFTGVFRLAPDNTVTLVDRTLSPNGIGVSPDGSKLYCTDRAGWWMWDLDRQGNATNKRLFVDRSGGIQGGDGFRIDADGNMWASSRDGVSIFTPQGKRIGIIRADDVISNCEIAADGHLYMSSNKRLIRVKLKPGARKLLLANV